MLRRLLNPLLLLIVFTTPLLPAYFGFGYEQIKVFLFLSLTVISGLIFTYLLSRKVFRIHWTGIKIASLLFLAVISLSAVFGIDPFESLLGRYPYYQGVILYGLLYLFFLMVSEASFKRIEVYKALTVSSFIVSGYAIFQFVLINFFNLDIPNYAGRVVSTLGQPNFYSGFLVLVLPVHLYLFSKSKKFWNFYLLSTLVSIAAIFLSFSRAAVFLTVMILAFQIFWILPVISRVLVFLFGLILVLILAFLLSTGKSNWDGGLVSGQINKELVEPKSLIWLRDNSPEKRVLIWPVIWGVIVERPYLGYGMDNLGLGFSGYLGKFDPTGTPLDPAIFSLKSLVLDRSHNYFLDLLVFSGVGGLLIYLIFVVLLIKKAAKERVLISVLVIYLVWVQFQNQSIVHLMIFWLIAGLVDKREYLYDDSLNA